MESPPCGSTVSPVEVEHVIEELAGVRQAIVVGAPDARLGEIGVAFVLADAGTGHDAVDEHCRCKLAGFKRPRIIRFVDAFPMTSTGKIQREVLRCRARDLVNEQQPTAAAA